MAGTGSPVIASSLPNYIVIKSNFYSDKGYAYYKENENEGSSNAVALGEPSVFSTLVKIELERSTASNNYVNLRFCYSNKFWTKGDDSKFLVADVDQPQEDVSKASCTLFQVSEEELYLVHVQSGGRLLIDSTTWGFYVEENPKDDEQGYLSFVDWETLIQLPENVVLKGSNGNYLRNKNMIVVEFFEFASEDPNEESAHTVELMDDGYVQMKATHSGVYWTITDDVPAQVVGRATKTTDPRSDFWPIKLDDNGTVALRNKQNNFFCAANSDGILLYASATSLIKEARLQVTELVLGRKIYNVRYLMEYARIYDEAPFVAGTAVLINDTPLEDTLTADVAYGDEKSYTYSRGTSFTAGVTTSIKCGVPFIAEGKVEVSFEISGNFQWDTTTTKTTGVTASAGVPVPPMTTTTVEYVGTRGTCNIPYTYTQEDQSSIDGQIARTDMIDGIYNGVSYYNFNFHVISNQPIQP